MASSLGTLVRIQLRFVPCVLQQLKQNLSVCWCSHKQIHHCILNMTFLYLFVELSMQKCIKFLWHELYFTDLKS